MERGGKGEAVFQENICPGKLTTVQGYFGHLSRNLTSLGWHNVQMLLHFKTPTSKRWHLS